MENKIYCLVKRLKADRVRRQRFAAVMIVLSMIVSSTVFWQLHSTGNALTDEFLCGMSEHKHSTGCLSLSCGNESEDHVHTAQCYAFSCGKSSHLHTAQCRSDISADIETEDVWEATLPEEMTGDKCENIAAVAESQLGYTESTKNFILADDGVTRKGYTRYGKWYGNPYGDWNTLFAYFCLYYAGVTEKELPYGSGCWAWTEALKNAELFNSPKDVTVKVGDLVFFDTDADEKPDRVGIVSEIREDEEAGITITAIEGDLDGKVDKAEYSLEDKKLAGFVSMDMFAESDLAEADLEFPELSLGDAEMAAYANGNTLITVGDNKQNTYQSKENAYKMTAGERVTLTAEVDIPVDHENNNDSDYYNFGSDEAAWKADKENYDYFIKNTATDDEKKTYAGKQHVQLTNGQYIYTYARFQNWGEKTDDDPDWNNSDKNVNVKTTYSLEGNKLKLTATVNTKNDTSVDYTAHIVEVQREKGYSTNSEKFYVEVKESTFIISKPYHVNTFNYIENAFEIEAGQSFTLQGKTTNYKIRTDITDEQYNNLSANDKAKIKKATKPDGSTVYVETVATIWDNTCNSDGVPDNNANPNFDYASWSYHINSSDELLVDATYPTKEFNSNESSSPRYSVMFFNDADDYSTMQKLYVKIKPIYEEQNFYVVGAFLDRNKDRINEDSIYVDHFSYEVVDGYIKNSDISPYILHKGDYVEVFVYVDEEYASYDGGYFSCASGDTDNPLEVAVDIDKKERNGRTVLIKKYKVKDDFNINGHTDVVINYNIPGGEQIPFYVRVAESCPIRGVIEDGKITSYPSNKFDHYDIEIADGGTYTDKRTIINADGSKVETYYVYESFVSLINGCIVYNANGDELTSLTKDDYTKEGGNNGTQFEFTSKFELQKESKKTHHQLRSDVKKVVFDVDVTLNPLNVTTIKYDAQGNVTDNVTERFTGTSFTMKNVKFNMEQQDIIDAANKCPDHSGLDFTVTQSVESVIEVAGINFEVTKKLVDNNDTELQQNAGDFVFQLFEEKNGVRNLVDTAVNDANGKVKFDRYEFFAPGTYTFYIKELIPNNKKGITYSDKELKVEVTVTNAGNGKLDVSANYIGDKVFINTLNSYTLPSTGGSGTTIFYICGPALMLTAAALFVIRRRKEENQH